MSSSGLARINAPLQSLLREQLPSEEAFVVSRLMAGEMRIGALVARCALPEDRVKEILIWLVDRGLVAVDP